MSRTPTRGKTRKAKKSFTLSTESVAFLEALRRKRRTSASALLEEILQGFRGEQQKLALDRAVTAHYDSLSQLESAEQSAWGEFAMREFPGGSA